MDWLNVFIVGLYGLCLLIIFVYTVIQTQLAINYLINKKRIESEGEPEPLFVYPKVTVQLPVYNERYVVDRLIDAVSSFDWPSDKLEIQVLDDSDDETVDIIQKKIDSIQSKGVDIQHIQREDRVGFKAGALAYGNQLAEGEFIAIFDADFIPGPDFLKQTIPYFKDDNIGLVQARWGHLNKTYSLMTKMQAFALNAHFTVEQKGRNAAGYLMNFNGTAGVWRKECIEDAGGWHHDTLTEDLDLSYRAQLKGWDFKFLVDVVSPAELPVAISALKTQQYRWTKGSAETSRKHLGNVWSSELPLLNKIHATSHLLSGGIFILIFLIAILSIPLLSIKNSDLNLSTFFTIYGFFSAGLIFWFAFYSSANMVEPDIRSFSWGRMLLMFPLFLSFSMGLSLHNSIAAIKGYLKHHSPFIRTPKFNITNLADSWNSNSYLMTSISPVTIIEGLLCLYFMYGLVMAVQVDDYGLVPFHLMLAFGFGTIFFYSLKERIYRLN